MAPPSLRLIGVDPGGTTGWSRLAVPRQCLYGQQDSEILDWDYGELTGPETDQVRLLCRLIRETQGLDYKVGPAVIVEDFDVGATVTTDADVLYSPVRIAAMLRYAQARGETSDARIHLQPRSLAKRTMTDDRLRHYGLWVEGSDHIRDATRHAVTALRRAKEHNSFRDRLWADPDCTNRRCTQHAAAR